MDVKNTLTLWILTGFMISKCHFITDYFVDCSLYFDFLSTSDLTRTEINKSNSTKCRNEMLLTSTDFPIKMRLIYEIEHFIVDNDSIIILLNFF